MKRYLWISSFLVIVSLFLASACIAPDVADSGSPAPAISPKVTSVPPRNIILIGWDGAQRNHVRESLGHGDLPSLKSLTGEGALVAIDILRITDTKAGWSQILTGYNPEISGVYSNGRYQPIPKGYTIFERLEKAFGADNFITVAVIGKKGHVDDDPPIHRPYKDGDRLIEGAKIVTENNVRYQVVPGKPYYYTREGMDIFINGLETDDRVGGKALELLEKYRDKPFFFFVHFAQVDHKGHAFGENSKEYNDALISADTWTGKIVQKLRDVNLYDRTLVYITSDHGFDEGMKSHNDAPYVFLGTNDPAVIRRGERADITPTILDRFGLDLSKVDPPLDGHSLLRPYQPPKW